MAKPLLLKILMIGSLNSLKKIIKYLGKSKTHPNIFITLPYKIHAKYSV